MKWIIDPGHSGLVDGFYLTQGKRSPEVPPGIYEGEFNRNIAFYIEHLREGDTVITAQGPLNPTLASRTAFANMLHKKFGNCALISIHANAAQGNGWSPAQGLTVFTHPQPSPRSATLASLLEDELNRVNYTYSRGIRKARFTMLTKTQCPSVLLELGFMTNKEEAERLADHYTQLKIAEAISRAMTSYEEML